LNTFQNLIVAVAGLDIPATTNTTAVITHRFTKEKDFMLIFFMKKDENQEMNR